MFTWLLNDFQCPFLETGKMQSNSWPYILNNIQQAKKVLFAFFINFYKILQLVRNYTDLGLTVSWKLCWIHLKEPTKGSIVQNSDYTVPQHVCFTKKKKKEEELTRVILLLTLQQRCQTLFLKGHNPAEFSCNRN